ncbi:MAG: S-methyl-5-thioribose-1-phosphate isomerase [Bacteroidales bacterium]|jgi:methylthioribose-1-phosphate isomerase|nr:S-methyl-5-thioribose-1-phosphate isomerase [Bacteroidales bacterium]MCI2122150.1 S-methyl-5-thioribose-1-phosphate isomerase [Bacteroidales bacterium]MCI2146177.1 S-methyl-5-thioribose-1-phosphate isomerase [Bacteroidales bacterium]
MDKIFPYDSVELSEDGKELIVLDQSVLPNAEVFLRLTSAEEIFFAITLLKVRGAPAIGIAAALGLAMCMNRMQTGNLQEFEDEFLRIKRHLYISRPTAVNLMWALDRMERCYYETKAKVSEKEDAIDVIRVALTKEARAIKEEDIQMCLGISENGFSLLKPGVGILTHCNAGHLAVSRYGTALGPIYFAQQRGYAPRVYCDETRPMLQGSRLTAYELMKAGVDTTLICDDMASIVMAQKKVDAVFVGCDRIAANGDVANKVGTSALAILARYYGIPFYVLGPTSTLDLNCSSGKDIVIEERPAYEVTDTYFSSQMAPKGVKVYNPAFDITPADLITGIVTEKGIFDASEMAKSFSLK